MEIIPLFPKVVVRKKLERKLTAEEFKAVDAIGLDTRPNQSNVVSNCVHVLEKQEFSSLKSWILESVKEYFCDIIDPKDDIDPYIVLSWINFTSTGQQHHKHSHGNSLISGVFYISADPKVDSIIFHDDAYHNIQLIPKNFNIFNSRSWWVPAETNYLVLFPSSLQHSVEPAVGDHTRISLSFNIFIKGNIGDEANLTRLTL